MKPIDLLYFEDVSPFHEAVFAFPIIGKLSMRQMTIIGFSAVVSWAMYQTSENLFSMIPLCIGAYLGLKKFNVKPPESQLVSVIKFAMGKKKSRKPQQQLRPKSKRLGPSAEFSPKLQVVGKKIKTRSIYSDPLKPIRFQIRLETPDTKPIAKTQTRVEFDGNVISTLATNHNGEIEVLIIPQTVGEKKLAVYAEGFEQPVFEEILSIH
jgi:hypothetical protein